MEQLESKVLIKSFIFSFFSCGLLSIISTVILLGFMSDATAILACLFQVIPLESCWKGLDVHSNLGMSSTFLYQIQCSTTWWYFILEYPHTQASMDSIFLHPYKPIKPTSQILYNPPSTINNPSIKHLILVLGIQNHSLSDQSIKSLHNLPSIIVFKSCPSSS